MVQTNKSQESKAHLTHTIEIQPWSSGYKISSICTATDLSYIGLATVSSTGCQYERIYPNDCDTNQHGKSFKNGEIP